MTKTKYPDCSIKKRIKKRKPTGKIFLKQEYFLVAGF